jgi:hypothetical protein
MDLSKSKHSDSLFIGCENGKLMQLSIRQKKVIKNYGKIMNSGIAISTITGDKKLLFLSDDKGH